MYYSLSLYIRIYYHHHILITVSSRYSRMYYHHIIYNATYSYLILSISFVISLFLFSSYYSVSVFLFTKQQQNVFCRIIYSSILSLFCLIFNHLFYLFFSSVLFCLYYLLSRCSRIYQNLSYYPYHRYFITL